jgi:hypothetical protein
MKAVYIVLGILATLFTIGQILQFLGIIGVGSSIAGIGFIILGGVAAYLCFSKAFATTPTDNSRR